MPVWPRVPRSLRNGRVISHSPPAAPTGEIADALDAGAASALLAGVPDLAIELAELALWHTVDHTQRPSRLDRLADAKMRAGDSAGAFAAQREAVELTPPGPARARRRIRLAEVDVEVNGWAAAETELDAAVAEAEADADVTAEVLLSIAAVTDDIAKADAAATRAVALLDALEAPDPVILSGALCQAAGAKFRSGRGLDHELFERAIALERAHPARRLSDRADASYAALLKYADDLDGARTRLTALLQEARSIGDLTSIAYVLAHLVHIEAWTGNLDAAERIAAEHLALAEQGSLRGQGAQARYNLAYVFAYRGRLDEARSMLVELRDDPATDTWDRHRSHGALGFVALSAGDPSTAIEHLDEWDTMLRAMHFREPGYSRSHLDRLCALVGVGRIEDASTFAAELRTQAHATGRASAAAVALTGEALVAAHSDRVDDAQRMFDDAIAWYDTSPLRFDRARTLLLAGQVHRRAKAKARARDAMLEAHREFTTFGAAAWASIAADELARVNVRPARVEPADRNRTPGGDARRRGTHQPRGRGPLLPRGQDGRGQPRPRVPQARHPFTRRARRSDGERVVPSPARFEGVSRNRRRRSDRSASRRPWPRRARRFRCGRGTRTAPPRRRG